MKPVDFAYERPRKIAAALAMLECDDISAKVLAGGQSLGPMLNMRLVQPDVLIDITGIAELKRVEDGADMLTLGACITHADIEDERVPDVTRGALPRVASAIAYRAVRNRGTIGGSLTHADPAADWVSSLAAIGAQVVIASTKSTRTIPVEDYMADVLESALQPGEMLEAVKLPKLSGAARWGYFKACRKVGEFAHAIGAVLYDPDRSVCRAVLGAIERKPIVLADASALFGGRPADGLVKTFNAGLADSKLQDAGVSDPIARRFHVAALRRAIAMSEAA
jgi:carbon-monoxide dehydrogenase medium subunit